MPKARPYKEMKVAIINHSDTRGGASVVTLRLASALADAGADVTLLVGRKESDSPLVVQGSALRRELSFAAEHLDIVLHNRLSRTNLFKISTGRFGMGLSRHKAVEEADIVVLAWVNQGTLSLGEIRRMARKKPVVWVMHDRWCQTGVCHHVPDGCQRLKAGCGFCPLLRHGSAADLSHSVYQAKRRLYGELPPPMLSFVAVSRWLAEAPGLTKGRTEVIPNVFPVESYPVTPAMSRQDLGLPEQGRLVVMGAARLDDPVKNFPLAITTLNALREKDVTAVFFGNLRDKSLLEGLRIPHRWLGPLGSTHEVASVMSHATVVLSSSRFETLPTTLIEGMSAGAVPVTTGHGGQSDIIDDGTDGYIAPDDEAATLAMLTDRALHSPFDRVAQHEAAARRFAAPVTARRYIALFQRLIEEYKQLITKS